ncbi:MAG: XRE family transcriptional regulator [Anaerolineaceae bacterium]|nr:XRE family transcriptional regulator [Anaerolineaceae bacterium]
MENLGIWFREKRKSLSIGQENVAHFSNLSEAQVSRIESLKSELTLFSIVKLAYALNIDLNEILNILKIQSKLMEIKKNTNYIKNKYYDLDLDDIEAFVSWSQSKPEAFSKFLHNSNKLILEKTLKSQNQNFHNLHYPTIIGSEFFVSQYINNCTLTIRDLGSYIRSLRKDKGITLSFLGEIVNVSHTTISRLERGDTERISFKDIVNIDKALELDGDLISISWEIAKFHTGVIRNKHFEIPESPPISWEPQELEYIDEISRIMRWIYILLPENLHKYQNIDPNFVKSFIELYPQDLEKFESSIYHFRFEYQV